MDTTTRTVDGRTYTTTWIWDTRLQAWLPIVKRVA